jgi:hypothetical protein
VELQCAARALACYKSKIAKHAKEHERGMYSTQF